MSSLLIMILILLSGGKSTTKQQAPVCHLTVQVEGTQEGGMAWRGWRALKASLGIKLRSPRRLPGEELTGYWGIPFNWQLKVVAIGGSVSVTPCDLCLAETSEKQQRHRLPASASGRGEEHIQGSDGAEERSPAVHQSPFSSPGSLRRLRGGSDLITR